MLWYLCVTAALILRCVALELQTPQSVNIGDMADVEWTRKPAPSGVPTNDRFTLQLILGERAISSEAVNAVGRNEGKVSFRFSDVGTYRVDVVAFIQGRPIVIMTSQPINVSAVEHPPPPPLPLPPAPPEDSDSSTTHSATSHLSTSTYGTPPESLRSSQEEGPSTILTHSGLSSIHQTMGSTGTATAQSDIGSVVPDDGPLETSPALSLTTLTSTVVDAFGSTTLSEVVSTLTQSTETTFQTERSQDRPVSKNRNLVVVGAVVGSFVGLMFLLFFIFCCCRRRRRLTLYSPCTITPLPRFDASGGAAGATFAHRRASKWDVSSQSPTETGGSIQQLSDALVPRYHLPSLDRLGVGAESDEPGPPTYEQVYVGKGSLGH